MTDLRYPLAWPDGWPRAIRRTRSVYKISRAQAHDELERSLRLMGASNIVISTDLPLTIYGKPYAKSRQPDDPGVAIYFEREGINMCMACDRFDDLRSNVRAIGLTIEGLRAVERAGVPTLVDRAFSGFAQLPATTERALDFREVLGLPPLWPESEQHPRARLKQCFRMATALAHPDRGGSEEAMREVLAALKLAELVLAQ